ncbi:MAG: putative DNA binding domain-containing protein [Candidatus Omnitrophica bacterium]|nr:putative DNA binding domain-containing protein [Candidatus Omnitrophota bacterium]
MVNEKELMELLADIESDRVERTTSVKDTDKFSIAICAFANDFPNFRKPGYLVIGADDSGKCSGLKADDELLRNLGNLRSNGNIQPLPAINIRKFSFPDGDVAVVEVLPSDIPPVRYNGQVWIRVGPRRALATEQEERILSERRVSSTRNFDVRPCLESGLQDIALGLFDSYRHEALAPDVIAANHRTLEEQLASLRFFDLRRNCPTNAGILLFGKNPRYFLPGAYIQYLRFKGAHLTDSPVDQAEISGDLLGVLRELDVRVKTNINTVLETVSVLRERMISDYPELAVRELLMNAVMHRDYESNTPIRLYWFEDRVEIQSPGGLYGEVTPENFMRTNSYRNPVIAEAMKALGYVNRYGYGIQRAQNFLKENGNGQAKFEFSAHTVLAVIPKKPHQA